MVLTALGQKTKRSVQALHFLDRQNRAGMLRLATYGRRIVKPLITMVLLGIAGQGCTHLPAIGGVPLPKLTAQEKSTFRNVGDIPDPPFVTPPDVTDAAIEMLSRERSTTEHAAEELRAEPFISPSPPPPEMPF
jgi:hypothetical protein